MKFCKNCGTLLRGRVDKQYCDDACRSQFHRTHRQPVSRKLQQIQRILRRNHRILADLVEASPCRIKKRELLDRGFLFQYFTHQRGKCWGKKLVGLYDLWYQIKRHEIILYPKKEITR